MFWIYRNLTHILDVESGNLGPMKNPGYVSQINTIQLEYVVHMSSKKKH